MFQQLLDTASFYKHCAYGMQLQLQLQQHMLHVPHDVHPHAPHAVAHLASAGVEMTESANVNRTKMSSASCVSGALGRQLSGSQCGLKSDRHTRPVLLWSDTSIAAALGHCESNVCAAVELSYDADLQSLGLLVVAVMC